MKNLRWLILVGAGLTLWLAIGLAKNTRAAILDFKDYDMTLALVRCLFVLVVWAMLKSVCVLGAIRLESNPFHARICFAIILSIDIVISVAIWSSPNRVAAFFGEPFVLRQQTM